MIIGLLLRTITGEADLTIGGRLPTVTNLPHKNSEVHF